MSNLIVKPKHELTVRYGTIVRAYINAKPQHRFRVNQEDMGDILVRIQGKGFVFEMPRAEFEKSFDVIGAE